jgi:transcriptional regulator with PAS, ATPase and Fis domain
LKKYGGNRAKTARELRIERTTLWRKIRKYGLL